MNDPEITVVDSLATAWSADGGRTWTAGPNPADDRTTGRASVAGTRLSLWAASSSRCFVVNDLPARIDPEEAEIGRPTPTARRLVEASVSQNTRRAYAGALRRLDA